MKWCIGTLWFLEMCTSAILSRRNTRTKGSRFIVHQYWKYLIGHDDTTEDEDEKEEYEDAKKCSSTAGYISRERGLQKGRSLTLTKTNLLENRRFIKRLYNFIHYTKKTRCPVLHYIFYWGEFIFIFIWRRNLKSWTPNWQF